VLRKENSSIRVVLHEKNEDGVCVGTHEDVGIPPYLFYAPKAEIKLGCEGLAVADSYLQMLYGPNVACSERLVTKEWALIAALNGGEIPIHHKLVKDETVSVQAAVWNPRIYEAGLKTQNYDKGFERFVRKFDPDLRMEATMAIVKGAHHEHGTAVLVTQEKRRCLSLDTVHGLSEDEVLWHAMMIWAKFQPDLKRPRTEPGQLFYSAEHSHVFEKY
jgi:hypothetical protein